MTAVEMGSGKLGIFFVQGIATQKKGCIWAGRRGSDRCFEKFHHHERIRYDMGV